jgi:plasmid stability protein
MRAMKQLLLRVPDDVHRRLAMRAAREGRSVNALATELLDLGAGVDQGDRRPSTAVEGRRGRDAGERPRPGRHARRAP